MGAETEETLEASARFAHIAALAAAYTTVVIGSRHSYRRLKYLRRAG